jgi:MATE family multidrug resistance protein
MASYEDHDVTVHPGPADPSQLGLQISEHTPLLSRSSNCVEEDAQSVSLEENVGYAKMFWEECFTLTKYSLPMFGSVRMDFNFAAKTAHP